MDHPDQPRPSPLHANITNTQPDRTGRADQPGAPARPPDEERGHPMRNHVYGPRRPGPPAPNHAPARARADIHARRPAAKPEAGASGYPSPEPRPFGHHTAPPAGSASCYSLSASATRSATSSMRSATRSRMTAEANQQAS